MAKIDRYTTNCTLNTSYSPFQLRITMKQSITKRFKIQKVPRIMQVCQKVAKTSKFMTCSSKTLSLVFQHTGDVSIPKVLHDRKKFLSTLHRGIISCNIAKDMWIQECKKSLLGYDPASPSLLKKKKKFLRVSKYLSLLPSKDKRRVQIMNHATKNQTI